jgi:hypothetical protein
VKKNRSAETVEVLFDVEGSMLARRSGAMRVLIRLASISRKSFSSSEAGDLLLERAMFVTLVLARAKPLGRTSLARRARTAFAANFVASSATAIDRSGSRSAPGNCLDGIALPSLAQAPVAGGARAAVHRLALVERSWRRAAHRAGASGRTGLSLSGDPWAGLGERSKAVSGMGERRPSWKNIGAGPGSAPPGGCAARAGLPAGRGLMEVAGLGLAGA